MEVKTETQTTAQRPQRDQRPRDQRPGPSPAHRTPRPGGVQNSNELSMEAHFEAFSFHFHQKDLIGYLLQFLDFIGSAESK